MEPLSTARPWTSSYRGVPTELPTTTGSILDAFREIVEQKPETVLVRYFDTPISAAEIDRLSDGLACAFQDRGINAGDRIALYLQNVPQTMITMLAAWKAGAVIVSCNPMFKGGELVKILSDSGSKAIVLHDYLYADVAAAVLDTTAVEFAVTTSGLDLLPEDASYAPLKGVGRVRHEGTEDLLELAEANRGRAPEPVELTSDDVAFMVYTSGTTGAPKGATNTHGNGFFAATAYLHWMGIDDETVILGLAPLFHVTGLTGHLVVSMISGAELLLFYRFDADEACRLVQDYRATFTITAITAFVALLGSEAIDRYDLSTLQTVYSGGAPTPTKVVDEWRAKVGSMIHPMYGLTEVTSPATMTPLGADYRSDPASGVISIGVPIPNTVIRVINDQGVESKPREIGELRISGPQVVPGYWQMPEETAAAIEGGELRTGDIGFMDEDGWLYLVDRAKDMIVASGFKVWPSEVEEVLYQHPAIREAGVIGVPDPYRGETVKAFVSLKPGVEVSSDEIKAFARDRMAAYKYPRVVEIIDDLPKNSTGKIMRRTLQAVSVTQTVSPTGSGEPIPVSYPEVHDGIQARAVLEIGATWLRLRQGGLPPSESASLYERLHDVIERLGDGTPSDRAEFFAANERFHAAVVGLLGNEHLSAGYRSLGLESLITRAYESTERLNDEVVTLQEQLSDAIASGNAEGACSAILAWGETSRDQIHKALQPKDTSSRWRSSVLVEDLTASEPPAPADLAADVEALLAALEARAAIEIGVTQLLVAADTTRAERSRFVARLNAAIPLVRGSGSAHAARYTRADDAYHRLLLGLLENTALVEIYNRIDIPELLFRVLESTGVTVRDALNDHRALTAAVLRDDADGICDAIAANMLGVRQALADAVASTRETVREGVA